MREDGRLVKVGSNIIVKKMKKGEYSPLELILPLVFSGCCADAARGRGVGRGVCIPWRGCVRENGRLVTAASN